MKCKKSHSVTGQKEIACLNEDLSYLKSHSAKTEAELVNSEKELKRLMQENNNLKSDNNSFYTGFPNLETFKATLSYLNMKIYERKSKRRDCNKHG